MVWTMEVGFHDEESNWIAYTCFLAQPPCPPLPEEGGKIDVRKQVHGFLFQNLRRFPI